MDEDCHDGRPSDRQRYTLTDQTKIVVGEPQTVCGLRVQPSDTQTVWSEKIGLQTAPHTIRQVPDARPDGLVCLEPNQQKIQKQSPGTFILAFPLYKTSDFFDIPKDTVREFFLCPRHSERKLQNTPSWSCDRLIESLVNEGWEAVTAKNIMATGGCRPVCLVDQANIAGCVIVECLYTSNTVSPDANCQKEVLGLPFNEFHGNYLPRPMGCWDTLVVVIVRLICKNMYC
ncbi:uncharacterized protein LOC129003271 [Macrosteles quadrilineatus]|uniref:uncharacterized protein LOC129003271 n=1 Tax=Macrosteles quadrilineatus TaxID=74068 RepID=UPI0023E090D0|nr:uncharacterized protein LOC129003271 [Macrosteles quadrilineatus]